MLSDGRLKFRRKGNVEKGKGKASGVTIPFGGALEKDVPSLLLIILILILII